MKPHSIKFAEADWAALQGAARAQKLSTGALINNVLAEYMSQDHDYDWRGGFPHGGDRLRQRLGNVFISVATGRAQVARTVNCATTPAANWEALEDEALDAVQAAGGFASLSGVYDCPRALAKKAQWS